MDPNENTKKTESANNAETKKQNEDFQNIPASSQKTNPSDVDKKDIKKSSENNPSGKTDNIKE
ncbi:hypothetical protein [Chryseobacterium gregarium]|uniref:hypothetical protein n=1 Tax=Chryseobacterium gregarium TaxID=456299 RepID=UPI0004273D65|nr:hypothetical protein [Chryseobacterium gregarium]